jgi:ribosome biogenesis GTPase
MCPGEAMSEGPTLASFVSRPADHHNGGTEIVPSREEQSWQHHRAEKAHRQVRKQIKRNRKKKRVRQRDWLSEDWDELDGAQRESIMPRGERERRRQMWSVALRELEEQRTVASDAAAAIGVQGQQGTVTEISTGMCRVQLGEIMALCTLRGTLSAEDTGFTNVVAVGDEVLVSLDGSDQGVVEAVLPRRSVLARPDVFHGHLQQVVVANVDQLLIVSSWRDPAIWLELIDRYLITAQRNGLAAVICVNKVDLAEDLSACQDKLQPYLNLGYQVLFSSAVNGQGVDALGEVLQGRTTVVAGLSGVGKSSLLTALQPDLQLRVSEVSARRHEGRHTTAQVTMLSLATGGWVVDTPGIREFGLTGLRRSELAAFYPEILAVRADCQFADCSHTHEPGCAVRLWVRRGRIARNRYHSYRRIYDSLLT